MGAAAFQAALMEKIGPAYCMSKLNEIIRCLTQTYSMRLIISSQVLKVDFGYLLTIKTECPEL